ncbi:MAG: hypothetical protein JXM70_24710 [Pirellulales bacterium]|nr:hypothetical protein [Pirellulales bacterium]
MSLFLTNRWALRFVGLGLIALITAGCGGGAPYEQVPVTGKVTYEDGSLIPAARISITFAPQAPSIDRKTHPRPAMAEVNVADGTFKNVTTRKFDDGATIGPNKVLIVSYDRQDNQTNAVPAIYRSVDSTPLKIEITPDDTHFELKVRKSK